MPGTLVANVRRVPSQLHETLLTLFRDRPRLASELLARVRDLDLPQAASVEPSSLSFGEANAPEYAADLVLRVRAAGGCASVVLEVQLDVERESDILKKRASWPRYLVWQWANTGEPAHLLVVTPSRRVERWAARPIVIGHPGFVLAPIVLGPSTLPRVVEYDAALVSPEMAVLSAIVHSRGPRAAESAELALEAALDVDPERRKLYVDAVLAVLKPRVRREIEAIMAQKHEYMSDFARRYVAEGKAEGKAEGVLQVLEARGFAVSPELAARVRACRDLATLDAWLVRAATLADLDAILG